jgi:hypothetical protein
MGVPTAGGTRKCHFAGTGLSPETCLPAPPAHRPDALSGAQVKTRLRSVPPPASMLLGVRVHYLGSLPGRYVSPLTDFSKSLMYWTVLAYTE